MQLNILRLGGSGARMVASGFVTRGGKVLRRIIAARSETGVCGSSSSSDRTAGLRALIEAMVCEPRSSAGDDYVRVCWAPEQSMSVGAQS
jgi:hypothetical protein